MSLLLRTTAIMLLLFSRAPAFAATSVDTSAKEDRSESQNEISSSVFRHSLSGLYGIQSNNTRVIQPYNDFTVLYSKAHQAQHELESLCKSAAMQTTTSVHFSGVKSEQRALDKIDSDFNGQAERITDLARATIVADDVPSLVRAYEVLNRQATIVKVKNRFKHPAPSGYRDLNVLVRLPKTQIIAEVQLHLKDIAEVKNGAEHSIYEQIQQIERKALNEDRALSSMEMAQIARVRKQSQQLYQQAWQPYITTQLQAA
ncbi:RelA/SpoT domain-containing protein [Vibrio tritonius]|uniref:RelA/SpoT domain-containing protein n=1 Tax=Vibrio tritonius TaxID=1435069 RepID=UPI00315DBE63